MKNKTMKTHTHTISMRRQSLADKVNLTLPALALALLTFASPAKGEDLQAPELPAPACDSLNVEAGNRLSSHLYALGVQIYTWTGTNWLFVGPEAALFADQCYDTQVGVHYGGPTWAADDGSTVKAAREFDCTPFRGAIPWLRLRATATSGNGRFARVTYIQRVNTIGGTAPAQAGAFVGDEARVPYTAEYYFYRATSQ
jgi:hypothetical protein